MSDCYVIGGCGFIGQHLVPELKNTNRNLHVISRKLVPSIEIHGVDYITGDFASNDILNEIIENADEIVFLAHNKKPNVKYDNPAEELISNIPGTIKLLSAICDSKKLKKVIFLSSGGTVYGNPQYFPINELHPTQPISPYGITKLTAEKYAYMFYKCENLPIIIARPGNVYGRNYVGESQGLIGAIISGSIINRRVNIFGDGRNIRDYIHVLDLSRAILSLLDHGKTGEIYNIGTGIGTDTNTIVKLVIDFVGKHIGEIKIIHTEKRAFDVVENILNSEKIYNETGWKAMIKLNDGINELIKTSLDKH